MCQQGLSISDFESDILCIPIFQSYINCVDKLLFNLDHIFMRRGREMISLQPKIINSLKEVEIEGNNYLLFSPQIYIYFNLKISLSHFNENMTYL